MSGSAARVVHHDRPQWQWWLTAGLAVISFVVNIIGFHLDKMAASGSAEGISWEGDAYDALQLFALHGPHFEHPNPWLRWGRWGAALAIGLSAMFGLFRIFRSEWRLRRRWRDHVVICGAGWRGVPLARDYHRPATGADRAPTRVIVIEKDPECPGLRVCETLGIPYIVGDAADEKALAEAGAARARVLVATCGNDGTNLRIAVLARRLVDLQRPEGAGPLKCYVHLSNLDLRNKARQRQLLAVPEPDRFVATTIGIDDYENAARLLFRNHPLDRGGPNPILQGSRDRVHLVILGFGQMGEAVLIQAGRICHLANETTQTRLRVTVFDRHAEGERWHQFRQRYPQLDEVCHAEYETIDVVENPKIVEKVAAICAEPHQQVTIVVSLPQDTANLAIALKLAASLNTRTPSSGAPAIRVRVTTRAAALVLQDDKQKQLFGGVEAFGMVEDVCNVDSLERVKLDALARAFHERYREKEAREAKPWDELPEHFRESNRHAADHIETKLRAIGCHLVPKEHAAGKARKLAMSEEETELLARMEHWRFCAERYLGGWSYAPGPKNEAKLTNPTLVPWEKLVSEVEREKDRSQVRAIPEILDRAGLVIVR